MGLGSYWGEVLDVLEKIIPVYDKVNSLISLGRDSEFDEDKCCGLSIELL